MTRTEHDDDELAGADALVGDPLAEGELVGDDDEAREFVDVPGAGRDGDVDPHFLALRGGGDLPFAYMPPAMPGGHRPWMRTVAVTLVAVFLAATAAGVCLTYGVPKLGF
jgi:hypothetical protein